MFLLDQTSTECCREPEEWGHILVSTQNFVNNIHKNMDQIN